MAPTLHEQLDLSRCPHCSVDSPTLSKRGPAFSTTDYKKQRQRAWATYVCSRCGGVVTATADREGTSIAAMFPSLPGVETSIPSPARDYLVQAIESRHASAGAVMLTACAVDATLKEKGYSKGSLYARIDEAARDHLITKEMAKWAHAVRLDANKPRHADAVEPLPDEADASRSIDFATALGEFLFVLPGRVAEGLEETRRD